MGSQSSQPGFVDLGTFWDKVPSGGEIIITRNKITISDSPRLDIGERVLFNDLIPTRHGQLRVSRLDIGEKVVSNDLKPTRHSRLRVSLSDLNFEDDADSVMSPTIRVIPDRELEDNKRSENSFTLSPHKIVTPGRCEFRPEFSPTGKSFNSPIQFRDALASYPTPATSPDISEGYSSKFRQRTDSLYFLPAVNSEGWEYLSESNRAPSLEENMRDLQSFLKQHLASSGYITEPCKESNLGRDVSVSGSTINTMTSEDRRASIQKRNHPAVIRNEEGTILAKKLATQAEQKGMRECHVYFTPRTSGEIWPPLVVTVGEEWNFLKVMRKSIADYQRSMSTGERDGTHDWLFEYHPNKDVKKIRTELKVLFGPKVISFRDSHLRKNLKDVTKEFINKMWILQKDHDKQGKARVRKKNYPRRLRGSKSKVLKNRSQSFSHKQGRKAVAHKLSGISQKV